MTPDKVWALDYELWPKLALAVDEIAAQRAKDAEDMKSRLSWLKRRRG